MNRFFSFLLLTSLLSIPVIAQWTQLTDFQSSWATSMVTDGTNLFVCLQNQGVFVSADTGVSWVARNSEFNFSNTKIAIFGNTLWAFNGGFLQRMNLSDTSWTTISASGRCLVVEGNTILLGNTGPISRSADNGATWNPIQIGNQFGITALGKHGNTFLAGHYDGDIYISTDQGETWSKTFSSTVAANTYAFFSHSSGAYAGNGYGCLRSTDFGNIWNIANTGLGGGNRVKSFTSFNNTIIVGTLTGVYYSNDQSAGPTFVSDWLTATQIFSLTVFGNYVFAGTNLGIWKRSVDQLVAIDIEDNIIPKKFYLGQNYPNPFNPSTTISFSIPTSEFVTLKVYDVLGNEVATLVNEEKPAGRYEVAFDASNISSGIYFYKLQAGNFVETKKMVVIR